MIFDSSNRFSIKVGKLFDPFQNSTIKCTWNFKVWTLQILNVGFQVLNFSFCKSSLASKDANLKIKENGLFSWVTFPTWFRNLTCWHSNFKIEKIVNKCSFGFHLTFLNQNVICFLCYSMKPLCKTYCRKTYPNDCFVIAFLWRSFHEWKLFAFRFSCWRWCKYCVGSWIGLLDVFSKNAFFNNECLNWICQVFCRFNTRNEVWMWIQIIVVWNAMLNFLVTTVNVRYLIFEFSEIRHSVFLNFKFSISSVQNDG